MVLTRTKFSKRFAWLPVRVRSGRKNIVIWLKSYYEKKTYVEGPLITGWQVQRSLKPFPKPLHLRVIK